MVEVNLAKFALKCPLFVRACTSSKTNVLEMFFVAVVVVLVVVVVVVAVVVVDLLSLLSLLLSSLRFVLGIHQRAIVRWL